MTRVRFPSAALAGQGSNKPAPVAALGCRIPADAGNRCTLAPGDAPPSPAWKTEWTRNLHSHLGGDVDGAAETVFLGGAEAEEDEGDLAVER